MSCETLDNTLPTDNADSFGSTKMIYLHLKKFFRGARFTSQGFLRCLQDKHRVGDMVCVSGKVGLPCLYLVSIRTSCQD